MSSFLNSWRFWLYLAAWLPFALCLLLYGFRSPWWQSWTGRSLMTLYAAIVAVLTLVLVAQVFDLPRDLLALLRFITLGAVSVAGFLQLANISRLQRRGRGQAPSPRRRFGDNVSR